MNATVRHRVQVTAELVRLVLSRLLRGLTTGLVVLGASCWCGYGAYAAWARLGAPSEASGDGERPVEAIDAVGAEAARGIAEIERYLLTA
jgi:hypothetical protein